MNIFKTDTYSFDFKTFLNHLTYIKWIIRILKVHLPFCFIFVLCRFKNSAPYWLLLAAFCFVFKKEIQTRIDSENVGFSHNFSFHFFFAVIFMALMNGNVQFDAYQVFPYNFTTNFFSSNVIIPQLVFAISCVSTLFQLFIFHLNL